MGTYLKVSDLSIALLALISSIISLGLLLPILRRTFLDSPTKLNSSHKLPKPTGGGLVFVVISTIVAIIFYWINSVDNIQSICLILIASSPLALVGLLDDRFSLSIWWRFGIQFLTVLILLIMSPLSFNWILWPILIIIGIAVINCINFIDGLDGVLGGSSVVFLCAAALSFPVDPIGLASTPLYSLIGAILGFLYWNWSPAKVFMGDVGSTFIGAVFLGVVLQQSTFVSALSLLLVPFLILADAGGCIIRRIQYRQPIFIPHKLMLYQRLNQSGWSHSQVAILYASCTAFVAIAHLLGGFIYVLFAIALVSVLAIWLDQNVAVSFVKSMQSAQK